MSTKTVHYISISRGEDREFLYSTEIYSQKLPNKDYKELELDENNIVLYLDPEESKIIAVSRSKDCVDSFLTGISFEDSKEKTWNDMYNQYIEDKQQDIF